MAFISVEPAARINLRWIVRLRWLAVAGQTVTILLARRFLHQPLPVGQLLGIVGLLAAVNLVMQIWLWRGVNPTDRVCGLNLLGDVLALTALLALSGGGYNPFALLYLVHLTIGAVVLPTRWAVALAIVCGLAFTLLHLFPEGPLGGEDVAFLHLRGRWVAFLVAAAFITTFSLRMSPALRRRDEELARTRSAAERARVRLPVRAFEQAIANLLDNAFEATEGREPPDVRIHLARAGDSLRLSVTDNGIGVPEHLLRRIGEPFFTTKEPGRGTGLGLYLARHVVEGQGGEMSVSSAEGRGTQVTLTVPEASQ